MAIKNAVPGTGGDRYVPYSERSGTESTSFSQETSLRPVF